MSSWQEDVRRKIDPQRPPNTTTWTEVRLAVMAIMAQGGDRHDVMRYLERMAKEEGGEDE